jgi:hypothetical protein
VVDPVAAGHLNRPVGGPIVNHQPLHLVESVHGTRESAQRDRQLALFVEAGNLDDQLHLTDGGERSAAGHTVPGYSGGEDGSGDPHPAGPG